MKFTVELDNDAEQFFNQLQRLLEYKTDVKVSKSEAIRYAIKATAKQLAVGK